MQTTVRILILNTILFSYACTSGFLSVKIPREATGETLLQPLPENINEWSSRPLGLEDGEIDRDGPIAGVRRIYEQGGRSVGALLVKEESGQRGMHSPVNSFTSNGWAVSGRSSLSVRVK